MSDPVVLAPAWRTMVAKGVSAIVAACDASLRPSLMRAMATHLADDGPELTVYLRRSQSAQLLQDIEASGRMAVVFSEPATNRTLQLKGTVAHMRPATAEDAPHLRAYQDAMVREIGLVGYGEPYVRAMLAAPLHDVVALAFQPLQAFDQTPGPRAGTPLAQPAPPAQSLGG